MRCGWQRWGVNKQGGELKAGGVKTLPTVFCSEAEALDFLLLRLGL